MTRKVTALLLAALMFLVLFAGCQSSNQSAGTTAGTTAAATTAATTAAGTTAAGTTAAATTAAATTAATTAPAAAQDAVTVDMWIIEHPSYLYTPGLLCEQLINEYVGIYFNVTPFQTGVPHWGCGRGLPTAADTRCQVLLHPPRRLCQGPGPLPATFWGLCDWVPSPRGLKTAPDCRLGVSPPKRSRPRG